MSDTGGTLPTAEEVAQLTEKVGVMAGQAKGLRQDVQILERKSQQDQRMLRIMMGLLVAKLITLILLAFVIYEQGQNTNLVKDCVTPRGQCTQRSQRQTAVIVNTIRYATEAERLKTEILVAQSKGDTIGAEVRQKRLNEMNALITGQVHALQDATNPRSVTTNTTTPAP